MNIEGLSVVLQGLALAGVLWLFKSMHELALRLATIEEHLRGADDSLARINRWLQSRWGKRGNDVGDPE